MSFCLEICPAFFLYLNQTLNVFFDTESLSLVYVFIPPQVINCNISNLASYHLPGLACAVVLHVLQGSMCHAFRDAFLLTMLV